MIAAAAKITSSIHSPVGARSLISKPLYGLRQPSQRIFSQRMYAKDFDALLMEVANKFEAADNKVPIIGWSAAAFFAITTAEWFMHLPLFNVLLGFPIQFLGLLTAANYGLKYYKGDKIDAMDEFEGFVSKVTKELPGIGK